MSDVFPVEFWRASSCVNTYILLSTTNGYQNFYTFVQGQPNAYLLELLEAESNRNCLQSLLVHDHLRVHGNSPRCGNMSCKYCVHHAPCRKSHRMSKSNNITQETRGGLFFLRLLILGADFTSSRPPITI